MPMNLLGERPVAALNIREKWKRLSEATEAN